MWRIRVPNMRHSGRASVHVEQHSHDCRQIRVVCLVDRLFGPVAAGIRGLPEAPKGDSLGKPVHPAFRLNRAAVCSFLLDATESLRPCRENAL